MNFTRLFLYILLSFPLFVNAQQTSDNGVFVYTVRVKNTVTGTMGVLLTDSIFVYNRIGIEKVLRSDDLIINDKLTTTTNLDTYYRINFDKRQFQELGKAPIFIKEAGIPFTTPKKKGINFMYRNYNGEKYTATDTLIKGKPCKVFRFIANAESPLKGAHVTLVFSDMKNKGIHIIPNLEDTFNGRFLSLEAVRGKDERIVLYMEHIQPLSDYWKKVIR
ncbi:hypothetical protein [Chitinophaga sp.]|uniref:hypothetical protein n=1 Tax=Chitinophaga sp. TaxID=1869181 RepID=UPI0031DC53CB